MLLALCREAGQERPTPLVLRYREGDWNALHQDLYGDVYFPFQVLTILSEPGVDFEGGEFVLMEQRPRAQSRAHVLTPPRGAFVIFPTRQRPNRGPQRLPPRRDAARREHGHARAAYCALRHLPSSRGDRSVPSEAAQASCHGCAGRSTTGCCTYPRDGASFTRTRGR